MVKTETKPGIVLIQISKAEDGDGYRGSMEFDNGEVLAEALAVLMLQAAMKLEVPLDMLYARVASLLFTADPEGQADE